MQEKLQRPNYRFEFLIIAIILPFTYGWIENLFYTAVYSIPHLTLDEIDELIANNYYYFDALFCMVSLLIYVPWFLVLRHRDRRDETREPKPPFKLHHILQWTVITLGLSGISLIWLTLIEDLSAGSELMGLSESLENFNETWSNTGEEAYLWTFLSIVLVGPLVEELLFRGLQFWYAEKLRKGWFVLIFTGISFGLWHGEPVQVVYTAVMGIALAVIYDHTRSFIAPLYIHILNNFISTLPPALDTQTIYNILDVACLISIIPTLVMLFLMHRKTQKRRREARLQISNVAEEVLIESDDGMIREGSQTSTGR